MRLLDLFIPPACAACGRVGALFCDRCLAALAPPSRPEDRFAAPDAGAVVGEALVLALAAFAYTGPMRRALAVLKYSGASRLAPILAGATLPVLVTVLQISGPAVLVPVPVHRDRERERGYDQARLLATELSRLSDVPMLPLLERRRSTAKQHRLDRAARLANLRDAFAVRDGVELPDGAIILVDDIITTTATLEACASVLCAAGAPDPYGVAVAREV